MAKRILHNLFMSATLFISNSALAGVTLAEKIEIFAQLNKSELGSVYKFEGKSIRLNKSCYVTMEKYGNGLMALKVVESRGFIAETKIPLSTMSVTTYETIELQGQMMGGKTHYGTDSIKKITFPKMGITNIEVANSASKEIASVTILMNGSLPGSVEISTRSPYTVQTHILCESLRLQR